MMLLLPRLPPQARPSASAPRPPERERFGWQREWSTLPWRVTLIALAGLLGLAAGPLAAQQPPAAPTQGVPTIRANTTLVEVPVLVLNKQGQPVETLSRDDFSVYDDGQLQHISGFDDESRPVSLAIIVDTSDYDAIGQAKRAAELITSYVVGAAGEASIFIPGPEPRQLVPFTNDANKLSDALRHLNKTPTAPLGSGTMVEPLNLAMMALRKQPRDRTRAALIISRSEPKSGAGAQALMESGMSDAIPIFRVSPNHPNGTPEYVNPDTPEQRGVGQGSQRTIRPPAPVGPRGQPTSSAGTASLDLGGIVSAASGVASHVLSPHHMDFVYASGGVSYSASNDNEFDQQLSKVSDMLRAFYHIYYSPNDLTPQAEVHQIEVKLDLPATSSVVSTRYRHSYLGIRSH